MSSMKALASAHVEREKELQSLREQWEVLTMAALAQDNALAKAQEEIRRLSSSNQQLSASSADLAERLAAVTVDRDKKVQDKTTRVSKERDYYKSELD